MEIVIAISLTLNLVLGISWLLRSEDGTLLRRALKAIADLGSDTSQGTLIDRGEVVRMAVQALAGNERSVLQRIKDWRERRKAERELAKAARRAGSAPPPSPPTSGTTVSSAPSYGDPAPSNIGGAVSSPEPSSGGLDAPSSDGISSS